MRILLTPAFLLFLVPVLSQSTDDKKSKEAVARNHIKNQVSWDYNYINNKLSKTGIKTSTTSYTASGDVSKVQAFNPKGQVVSIEVYKYDDRGNRTEYTRYSGGTENQAAFQKLTAYNDKNLITEETGYDGVENFRNQYFYNSQGEMSEIRYFKGNVLKEKRVFSKSGNITTVSIYNAAGTMLSRLQLTYDSRNNLVEEAVFGVNQSELEKKTYNYDENKNLKVEAKYKLDKITLKTYYNYNTSGNLLEISEESPGSPRFTKKQFSYSPQDNLLEIKWRRKADEEFNSISYAYDAKGLCITAETFYPATRYRVLTRYDYEGR